MNIKLFEVKKIITSPILIILTAIFIIYNGFIIYENSYIREDLKLANNLIDKYGYEVNDGIIDMLQVEYDKKIIELNNVTRDRFNKEFNSISEFLDSEEYKSVIYIGKEFTQEEIDLFVSLSTIDLYKNSVIENIESYESIDIMNMAEGYIMDYELSGRAAELVRENYKKLLPRFEELKNNKEHKKLFFVGTIYKTHSLLFRKIFGKCLLEIMALVVLMVGLVINYERENKTLSIVSVTKRGRNLVKDKLAVCIGGAITITVIILGVTLIFYFITFDYTSIYNVPISSALNWELTPVISWYNISFIQYLSICIVIAIVLAVIFTGIDFIIASVLKDSYKTFFVFFMLFGLVFMLPRIIDNSYKLLIWSHYNVFILSLNPHMWLREAGPFMTDKYFMFKTLVSNGLAVLMLSYWCIKRFKKENIS